MFIITLSLLPAASSQSEDIQDYLDQTAESAVVPPPPKVDPQQVIKKRRPPRGPTGRGRRRRGEWRTNTSTPCQPHQKKMEVEVSGEVGVGFFWT